MVTDWDAEVSSIDQAPSVGGVFYLPPVIHYSEKGRSRSLAYLIFNRVGLGQGFRGHCFATDGVDSRKSGFLPYRWGLTYSEMMMSTCWPWAPHSHPLPVQTCTPEANNSNMMGWRDYRLYAQMFVHQYSQEWCDFGARGDRYADSFKNSVIATEVHRQLCLELGEAVP